MKSKERALNICSDFAVLLLSLRSYDKELLISFLYYLSRITRKALVCVSLVTVYVSEDVGVQISKGPTLGQQRADFLTYPPISDARPSLLNG